MNIYGDKHGIRKKGKINFKFYKTTEVYITSYMVLKMYANGNAENSEPILPI
jgi:hypothetical protein